MTDKERDHCLIAQLFVALTKESWEEGPSFQEAEDAAKNWWWENYGDEKSESAIDGLRALAHPSPAEVKESGEGSMEKKT